MNKAGHDALRLFGETVPINIDFSIIVTAKTSISYVGALHVKNLCGIWNDGLSPHS